MSENDKDNKDYEFIKEQIMVKKRKKLKKWLFSFAMTVVLAVIFGLVAAITFCLAEPRLFPYLHKEEEIKQPVSFPTEYPEDPNVDELVNDSEDNIQEENPELTEPVIIEHIVSVSIVDYEKMYSEIRLLANATNKSIFRVQSTMYNRDLFGNPVERKVVSTGVAIADNSAELLLLVSYDRVRDASNIKMLLSDTITVDASIKDYEKDINLAVLSVKLEDIPVTFRNSIKLATLGESFTAMVGSPIIALGNPNGYPYSMEIGVITSRGSTVSVIDNKLELFNTSIRDNKNSDGIIINMKGEIIGLITRTLRKELNEELNTVIGISRIKTIIERMANKNPRIYFGIKAEDMTEDAKSEHTVSYGIYINEVDMNSPAFTAGLKSGDIIIEIEDQVIASVYKFNNIISGYSPDEEIEVKVKRTSASSGKDLKVKVRLEAKSK